MRLAFRLALTFGLLAAASSVLVGVAVRYRLVATETERFREEVGGICERIKGEVNRQAEADHLLITGMCEGGELVERVGVSVDNGEIDERRYSYSHIVKTERKAFGMDELLVGVDRGDILFASPTSLIGIPPAEVDALIRVDGSGFVLRTSGAAAIVTRCTKPSTGGRIVGMVAARFLDPMIDRIARTLDIMVVPSWPKQAPTPDDEEAATPSPAPKPQPHPTATAKPKHGKGASKDPVGAKTAPVPSSARVSTAPSGSAGAAGMTNITGGAERATCRIEDGRGAALPFEVIKSTRELEANLQEVDRAIGILAIVAAVVAFFTAVLLARSIGRPLAVLAQEVGKVAAGDAQPIQVRGSGEVRELGTAFDRMIKDLAVTRRRLAAASRVAAWREVARRVAHEVKNPLAPIRAAVETLRRLRAREDPRFDEYFDEATRTVLDEVHRISNIVTEFTRFARLPQPRPQDIDVEDVARHVVQVHKPAAGDTIHLSHVTQRRAPAIRADRDQVIQVLTNLVQNALDAVKDTPNGAVTLATDTDGHYVSFAVSDNGPGISPEFAGRLFEPYATTKTTGTGLGLAIAQRIAYEHNGELSYVGPSSNGRGAVFRLVLPVEGPPPTSETPPPPSGDPHDAI